MHVYFSNLYFYFERTLLNKLFFSFGVVGTKILFLCKQRTYDDKFKLARIYNKDVYVKDNMFRRQSQGTKSREKWKK